MSTGTTFRTKVKKQALVSTRETLHSRHLDMVKQFRASKKTVGQRKKELKDLQFRLQFLEGEQAEPCVVAEILDLKDAIAELKSQICRIEENEQEDNYYLQNADIIFQYFQNMDEVAKDRGSGTNLLKTVVEDRNEVAEDFGVPKLPPSVSMKPVIRRGDAPKVKSVIDFFKQEASLPESASEGSLSVSEGGTTKTRSRRGSNDSDTSQIPRRASSSGLREFVECKENFARAKMLDKYMSNIDPTHVITLETVKDDPCPECGCELIVNSNEGMSECNSCAYAELIKVDSDKRSYKESSNNDMSYIAYKRINHFEHSWEWNSELKVCNSLVACAA